MALAMVAGLFALGAGSAQAVQTPGTNGPVFFDTGAALASANLDGTSRTVLGGTVAADGHPEAAPSGGFIVFDNIAATDLFGPIVRSNNDGTGRTIIVATNGRNPAVSADSSTVVFECATGLCTASAAGGGGVTQLTGSAAGDSNPDYDPAGTNIVFTRGLAGLVNRLPSGGGAVTALTGSPATANHPRVAPDGTTVAFNVAGTGIQRLSYPNGGGLTTLTGTPAGANDASITPGGDKIVFDVAGVGLQSLNYPGGGGLTTLTGTLATDIDPGAGRTGGGTTPPTTPPSNTAPTFTAPASGAVVAIPVFGTVTAAGTVAVSANDTAGQTVTLTASGLPSWATFTSTPGNPATGQISANPSIIDWATGLIGGLIPIPGLPSPTANVTLNATDNGTPQASSSRNVTLRIVLFPGSPI